MSVTLTIDNKECETYIEQEKQSHAKNITSIISKLTNKYNLSLNQLNAIAVNQGPGSFTGLRVASSVAKGLCFALDIPLIAIDGLKIYSKKLLEKNQNYSYAFILVDARRDNYFYAYSSLEFSTESRFDNILNIEKEISKCVNPLVINSKKDIIVNYINSGLLIEEAIYKYKNTLFSDVSMYEPSYIVNNYNK